MSPGVLGGMGAEQFDRRIMVIITKKEFLSFRDRLAPVEHEVEKRGIQKTFDFRGNLIF